MRVKATLTNRKADTVGPLSNSGTLPPPSVAASRQRAQINSQSVPPPNGNFEISNYPPIKVRFNASTFQRITPLKAAGFTLIEIMLALAIFTMLTAALYSTWVLVVRATIVGKSRAAQLQRERIAMQTLEDSLTCIQSHQASIDYYLFDVEGGEQPLLSFTAYLPDDFPRSGEFLSSTPDGVPMDYHLRRLTYTLQADDGGHGKDLVLRQNPILMDMSAEEQKTPLVLAKNVTAFMVECWDTNAMQWDTAWDATNMLPPLVRVTLAFGDVNSGPAQIVTREISFPSSTMPTIVQTPSGNGNYIGGQNFFKGQQGNPPGNGQGNGQPGNGSSGMMSPQSFSMQGQPPNLGPPSLPETPPSHAP
ncbi:MAG TPA: prepilin-type N-terminal cleavage/methylation domain-containing protein [Verrucomicrobiae bacterium]|nr:prepilin-type N-terminal cleavage/methylation domain-containing protein [Verrucomicrobiae bacterium]